MSGIIIGRDDQRVVVYVTGGQGGKGDPGSPGEGYATRGAMAAAAAADLDDAYLTEAGRQGKFVFSTANLSTQVAADPGQGIYVAKSSDPTGASGAWVRQFTGPKDARWFGAAGNGVTDDAVALQRWLDAGGHLYLPAREFYSSARLIARRLVVVDGESYGFDARLVDGSATLGYDNQPGSRIRFAAGVGGIDAQPQTTVTDVATAIAAGVGGFTQEGARGSMFRNIALIGAGTGAAATGFYSRTLVHLFNVHAYKFMGKGFDISASGDAPDGNSEYGNASLSVLIGCHALNNGSHGFHIRGRDANVIKLDSCNAANNGGWGFNDDGLLANLYANCHVAANASGSYRASGAVAFHLYDGCYVEFDAGALTSLTSACTVVGGPLANAAAHPSASLAFVLNAGEANRRGLRAVNDLHALVVRAGLGRDPSATGGRIAQWFGTENDPGGVSDEHRLKYNHQWTGVWAWNYRNAIDYMEFASGQTDFYATLAYPMAVGFPHGIAMGTLQSAPRLLPAAAAAPVAGTFRRGDIVPNSTPSAGGFAGWICTAAGSPGTWKTFGAISA